MLQLDGIQFPAPNRNLYPSQQAAHDEMLSVVNATIQELKADGVPVPEFDRFYADIRKLWEVWSHFCPSDR